MPPPLGFTSARAPLVNRAGTLEHLDTDGFQHVPAALGVPAGYVLASGGPGVRPAWTPLSGVSVASVFGRTGAVVATSTDYASFYQPLSAKLTNFAALANAAGVLTNDGAGNLSWTAAGGGGTVTSVGLAMPSSIFDVTGSPVATSGTLTASLKSQSAALFLASPALAAGVPSMRAIASTDLPGTIAANTTGSAATLTTGRTLTIGSTGKPFNGSVNVAWSLAEIGAQPQSSNLDWLSAASGNGLVYMAGGGLSASTLSSAYLVRGDGSGVLAASFLPASGGSANKIVKWINATTQGYGIATDNGTTFSVAGTVISGNTSFGTSPVHAGYAGWSASAFFNTNGYALIQNGTTGAVYLNAPTGQAVHISINDGTDIFEASATGIKLSSLAVGGVVKANATTGLLQVASSGDITSAITAPTFTGGAGFDFLTSTAMSSALIRIGDGSSTHAVSFPKVATKSFSVAGTAEFADIVTSTKVTAGRVSMTQTGFAITDAISVPDAGTDKSWTFNCETILNKVKSFTFDGVGNFDVSAAPVQKLRSIVVTAGSYELPIVAQGESVQIIFNVSGCDVSTNSTQSTTALGSPYGTISAVGTYGHGAGSNRRSSILLTGVSPTRSSIIA